MLPINMISVAGTDIRLFPALAGKATIPLGQSQDQAFGNGTTATLGKLRAGIIGLSGTGSPLLERLKLALSRGQSCSSLRLKGCGPFARY